VSLEAGHDCGDVPLENATRYEPGTRNRPVHVLVALPDVDHEELVEALPHRHWWHLGDAGPGGCDEVLVAGHQKAYAGSGASGSIP
jgi:hypothetical protein